MNLHEYQAKELLKKYNVPVQEGIACNTATEAEDAYKQIHTQYGSKFAVVKAQIHAGGRGKGTIVGKDQRGVAVGKNAEAVKEIAQNIIGGTLVTIQTGPAGKVVNKVLVAQDVYYDGANPVKEFYLSILLDRTKGQNVIMYSTEGGMNIEDVAHDTPEKIFKEWVYPGGMLQGFQARKIAFNLGLSGEAFKNCVKFVTNLYSAYHLTRKLVPAMKQKKNGHIFNMSSIAGLKAYPGGGSYSISKFALRGFSVNLREELKPYNIKVTSVNPGMVETEFSIVRFDGDKERAKKVYEGLQPLKPEDIAETILWVANRPSHVNINDIVIMPSVQATSTISIRKTN